MIWTLTIHDPHDGYRPLAEVPISSDAAAVILREAPADRRWLRLSRRQVMSETSPPYRAPHRESQVNHNHARGFILMLRPTPNCDDPTQSLRRLLRYSLRACRLRCTVIRPAPAAPVGTNGTSTNASRPADILATIGADN